jgi:hypothetical protein
MSAFGAGLDKADQPIVVLHFLDADGLPGETLLELIFFRPGQIPIF